MENAEKNEQIELELDLEPLEAEKKEDELVVEEAQPEIEVKQPELSVDDGINELKARLEEERKAREAAERRFIEAQEQAKIAKNSETETNLRLIENAINTVKNNQEILQQNFKDAMAVGDFDTAAKIQADMTRAEIDLRDLKIGKTQYETAVRQQSVVDPVEKLAAQATPESAKWLREHKTLLSDGKKLDRALRAHQDAIDDGVEVDTPDYFQYIENRLGLNRRQEPQAQQEESALSEAASPTQRRSAPPAAPVSRSAPNNSGTKSNVIRLTAAEREHAASFGMTDREYALQKQALIKAGKMAG